MVFVAQNHDAGHGFAFSLAFVDLVFGILPCVYAIVAAAASLVFGTRNAASISVQSIRGNIRARPWNLVHVAALAALHLASLVAYLKYDATTALSTAAYAIRLIAAVMALVVHLILEPAQTLPVDFFFVASLLCDAVRVQTIWASSATSLAALQTAVIAVNAIVVILGEVFAPKRLIAKPEGELHVSEANSGPLEILFLGWVGPLILYGNKHKITSDELFSAKPLSLAVYKPASDQLFFTSAIIHFVGAMMLQILGAGATLMQPLIISAIVSNLQEDGGHDSTGAWLIVAMFFDQFAIGLLEAHSAHSFDQLSARVRSYLVQSISLRSSSPNPPAVGWAAASSKTLVLITQDTAAVVGALPLSGLILPNVIVIAVGSYLLYTQIRLAFLGPLFAAAFCIAVPMLLGKPLSKSQGKFLVAAEKRIEMVEQLISNIRNMRFGNMQRDAVDQANKRREQEIRAATAFRYIIIVVTTVAVLLSSLAILAAFGGYSLMPLYAIDYNVLFASLSTMQIMMSPLVSIIQMLPEFFSAFVSWRRIQDYIYDNEAAQSQDAVPVLVEDKKGAGLLMDSVTAAWEDGSNVLQQASLSLPPAGMAVVLGPAGSGKSSLIKAVLGELRISSGQLQTTARKVAFCDQTPWFLSGLSIKENILFGKPFDAALYAEVLRCCCLEEDFKSTVTDATTLHSSGTPLSGGQRKRVALARTLYSGADLLLLDDIYTGLDAKTRSSIAYNLVGQDGFLSKRQMTAVLCCIEPPTNMYSFSGLEFYEISSGALNRVERTRAEPDTVIAYEGSKPKEEVKAVTKESEEAANKAQAPTQAGTLSQTAAKLKMSRRSMQAHQAYFKSFGHPLTLALVLIFLFAFVGLDKAGLFWLSHWTSQMQASSGYYIAIYAAFAGSSIVAVVISMWVYFVRGIPSSSIHLHSDMLSVLAKTPAYVVESCKAETVNRFINDVEAVDFSLPQALQNLLFAVGASIGSVIVIGIGAPYALVALALLAPVLFFLQRFYLRTSFQVRTLRVAAQAPMLDMATAAIEGRVTIRSLQQESYLASLLRDRVYHAVLGSYIFNSIQTWITLMVRMLNACLATVVAAVVISLPASSRSVGWGGLALVNIISISQEAFLLLTWWTRFESGMASMERIHEYTHETPQERTALLEASIASSWPEKGEIEIEQLSLTYGTHAIIPSLDLSVAAGSKVAILGRTGSGKTSLLQSFFGLIEQTGGSIKLDGADLAHVGSDALRGSIVGHAQQFLPNTTRTVRQNLHQSASISDERLREMLSGFAGAVVADDVMSKLDQAWNECSFSEGTRQYIGICRTLLRESSVYIMDEPTSGMDDTGHEKTMAAMFDLLQDKTVVMTTHSLAMIERFDLVVVMENGAVVEKGSPEELMGRRDGALSSMLLAGSGIIC